MVNDDKDDLFKSWFRQYSSAYITQVAQSWQQPRRMAGVL